MVETIVTSTSAEQRETLMRLEGIFLPAAMKQRIALFEGGNRPFARFVHYTSAEAALSIIRTKRMWLRNTNCMTDFREVEHGHAILQSFLWNADNRKALDRSLDAIYPGIVEEALNLFDTWWAEIRLNTYIASISEHDGKEDQHGRLSMWRAFGNQAAARVALVFRIPWITDAHTLLNILFHPVSYRTESEAHVLLQETIVSIQKESEFLRSFDRQRILDNVFNMIVSSVTNMKHEGFLEEREWRAIYLPKLRESPVIEPSIEVIGGTPQMVYKLPLDAQKSADLADLDLANIFDRVIVGPTQYPSAVVQAFAYELSNIGIYDALSRIYTSGIPIRC